MNVQVHPTVSSSQGGFSGYVDQLGQTLSTVIFDGMTSAGLANIQRALDGEPSMELRRHYSLSELRSSGTFLTGSKLANQLAAQAVPEAAIDALFCDPACGAGDLLLATARYLPVLAHLDQTLAEWGKRLVGFDLQPLLVRATKMRLALLAISLGAKQRQKRLPDLDALFPHIRVADGTASWNVPAAAFSVLVNPPFTRVTAPPTCEWGSGLVSKAALFLEACLDQIKRPASIHAILPDVLRTGSRYEKWRHCVSNKALVRDAVPMGRFDPSTDVDVFAVHLELPKTRIAPACNWGMPRLLLPDYCGR
jgi:type I restriction-modification system DNA methylase subunit